MAKVFNTGAGIPAAPSWIPKAAQCALVVVLLAGGSALAQVPSVASVFPDNDSHDVAVDGDVTATFSVAMSPATAGDFILRDSYLGRLSGVYGGGGTVTLSLDPDSNLLPGTLAEVSLTGALESDTGTAVAAPYVWQFRTTTGVGPAVFDELSADFGTGTDETWTLALADLDGDGDLDLAAGNLSNEQNGFYLNNGDKTFASRVNFGTGGDQTRVVIPVDVDGDGDVDLAVGNESNEQNLVWLNDGAVGFSGANPFGTGNDATIALAVGDLDGDGFPDMAVGNDTAQDAVYVNNGDGSFAAGMNFGTGSDATFGLALGDVDRDGDLDLATGHLDDQNVLYLNDGSGDFSGVGQDFGTGTDATWSAAFGDADADGDVDLAIGNFDGVNQLHLNDGAGDISTFSSGFGSVDDDTGFLVFADVDGDGDLDLATRNHNQQSTVHLNGGNADFSGDSRNIASGNTRVRSLALGDLDGDGDLDIAMGASNGQQNVAFFNHQIVVDESTLASGPVGAVGVAASDEVEIFKIGLTGDQTELVNSITLTLADLTTPTGIEQDDFSQLRFYSSTDAIFDAGDVLLESMSRESVNIGSPTIISAGPDTLPDRIERFYIVTMLIDNTVAEGHAFTVAFAAGDISTSLGGRGSDVVSSDLNRVVVDVTATRLAFSVQPAGVISGQPMSTQPVVEAQDDDGNVDSDFTETVSLTLTADSAGILAESQVAAVNGVATFVSLTYTTPDDREFFTLRADDVALVGADLAIVGSDPTQADVVVTELVFTTLPADVLSGTILGVQPVVAAVDADGNIDRDFVELVTLSTSAPGELFNEQILAVGGVANFTTLAYIASADGELLEVVADDEDGAGSDLTAVAAPSVPAEVVATLLGFIVEPMEIRNGEIFGIPPVVAAIDTNNVVDEDFEGTITLSLNNQNAELTNNVLELVDGVADFSDLTITGLGSGRFLTATTDSLDSGRSNEFSVTRADFLIQSTPPSGLDGGSTALPGEEIQLFSIGLIGDGQHNVSSISVVLADLGRTTDTTADDFAELRLYTSTDDSLDAADILIGSLPQSVSRLRSGWRRRSPPQAPAARIKPRSTLPTGRRPGQNRQGSKSQRSRCSTTVPPGR